MMKESLNKSNCKDCIRSAKVEKVRVALFASFSFVVNTNLYVL